MQKELTRDEILRVKRWPRPEDLDYQHSSVEVDIIDGEYMSFYSEGRRGALSIDYDHAILDVDNYR